MSDNNDDLTPADGAGTGSSEYASPPDDDLAASWENSLAGESEEGATEFSSGGDKILSQNEIDSLLGISNPALNSKKSGIFKILESGNVYYERLPMLEVVFDRLIRLLSTTLRNFTGENVEVTIDSMSSSRFSDYINSVPLPAMISIVRAVEWGDFMLLTADSPLIYSIVDVLLGGRKGNALMRIEGRPFTTIERKLIQRLIEVILADFKQSFEPLCEVNFEFDRLETNPTFAAIARPGNAAVVVSTRVEMEDRGGKIEFLIPYATIEPIRELLLQTFMGEKFGQDSIWENHLAGQLWTTDFYMDAILGEATVSLGELLRLKKGSQILLNESLESHTKLRCGEHTLFAGPLGRKGTKMAIRIEQEFFEEEESHDKYPN